MEGEQNESLTLCLLSPRKTNDLSSHYLSFKMFISEGHVNLVVMQAAYNRRMKVILKYLTIYIHIFLYNYIPCAGSEYLLPFNVH